ncbi:MAG: hypothetical protein Q9208_006447 [Pyrenodesmia sp. 3 TL-2023]
MAVEAADGGTIETKRPLTPPADLMDVDMNPQSSDSLLNGHQLKDSSPNTAPLTGNSTQATSIDDIESSEVNGVHTSIAKANEIASKLNSHYSVSGEGDRPPIATPDQSYDHTFDLPKEGADEHILASTSPLPQPPNSERREELQPATLGQTTEIKEAIQQADIDGDPDLVNGVLYDQTGAAAEVYTTAESLAPAAPVVEAQLESAPPGQVPAQGSAATKPSIATIEVPHHPPVPIPDGKPPEAPLDPAPSPNQPMSNTDQEPMSLDLEVAADLHSPSKMSRPREDDGDEAPAAKRSRLESGTLPVKEESTDAGFKVPAQPGQGSITDFSASTQTSSEPAVPITNAQKKHMVKVIQNIKRSNDAKPFAQPVDIVGLNIPTYPDFVKNPMDLKTMEEKLKSDQYASLQAFKSDFQQIVQNSIAFNGPEHAVTKSAQAMAKTFERGMANLPGLEVEAPAPVDKKARKTSLPLATKAGPPKREPRASLPAATAPSPVTARSPNTTFALNTNGVPLIRRDSTKGDGRPKRDIHPPAPRDLPYAHSKPKKKKFQAELKFCSHVLDEIVKPKYKHLTDPFAVPVDPIALNIPDYFKYIKKPMDLSTMKAKLESGQYENASEFDKDMRLIFFNCRTYNKPDHPICNLAGELEKHYNYEMDQQQSWIKAHSPVSGAQSPTSSDDEDEEDEDDEDEAEEDVDEDQLTILQRSIAQMSEQVRMLQRKKKSPPAAGKKAGRGVKPEKKAVKKTAPAKPAKQEKKAPAKHSKKEQYVTYEQKQDISNRINSLSEPKMAKALKIIRDNMPSLKVHPEPSPDSRKLEDNELTSGITQGVQDDELELDIDELSDDVLRKLHEFVRRNSKGDEEAPRPPPVVSSAPAPARKKNKPMSKQEQERQIQDLKNISSQFQNPTPSIENAPDAFAGAHDTSGDEDDSEESEEE